MIADIFLLWFCSLVFWQRNSARARELTWWSCVTIRHKRFQFSVCCCKLFLCVLRRSVTIKMYNILKFRRYCSQVCFWLCSCPIPTTYLARSLVVLNTGDHSFPIIGGAQAGLVAVAHWIRCFWLYRSSKLFYLLVKFGVGVKQSVCFPYLFQLMSGIVRRHLQSPLSILTLPYRSHVTLLHFH